MIIVVSILTAIVWLALSIFICALFHAHLDEVFHPLHWKAVTYCNWLGVILITMFLNLIMLPLALCYWIYEVCHI